MPHQAPVFRCRRCGQCCYGRGGIRLTEAEALAAASHLGLSGDSFKALYLSPSGPPWEVEINEEGFCRFHQADGSCLIHPVKPAVCRTWPFLPGLLEDESALAVARNACPGLGANISLPDFRAAARPHRLSSLVSFFRRQAADILLSALAPPICPTCSRRLPLLEDDESGFCPHCLSKLERGPELRCPLCGRPYYHGPGGLCGDCLKKPPPWQSYAWALVYDGTAALSLRLLKFHNSLRQVPALAALVRRLLPGPCYKEGRALAARPHDFIVPLPLSRERLKARGFNQCEKLVRAIYAPWPELCRPDLLRRRGTSPRQSTLNRVHRLKQVRGCFEAPYPSQLRGAAVLLFDDVLTTGATAGEAARTLLEAGASRVDVVTLARTVLRTWR